jgi:hypothetical protein
MTSIEPMKVLSLGWGVQSFTLAAMVALGELEPIDTALHADTTHEASGTYEFARNYTPWLESRGIRVVTVSDAQPLPIIASSRTDIPAFTGGRYTVTTTGEYVVDEKDELLFVDWPDGEEKTREIEIESRGQLRRQCTGAWKISPMRKWLQANRNGRTIEQWIGISLDEVQRMKDSDVKYIAHRWPLIERRMTRSDCRMWLLDHGLDIPPKSACVFCPYHDKRAWHDMVGADWQKAVEIDDAIRKVRPPYDLYLHPSRQPLRKVDFSTPEEQGQYSLWNEECAGICGV